MPTCTAGAVVTDYKFEGYLPSLGHWAKFWLILLGLWVLASSPFMVITWFIARAVS